METPSNYPPQPRLIGRKTLKQLGIEISNSQLLRMEREGRFPRRLRLTPHRIVWHRQEILDWIDAKAAERSRD